jgi:ribonuclease VapC
LNLAIEQSERMVRRLLEERGVTLCDLPPANEAIALGHEAAGRFRGRSGRLNLADCFHYACARHYRVPILSTADEFRFTDIETVP